MLLQWLLQHRRLLFILVSVAAIITPVVLNYYVDVMASGDRYNRAEAVPKKPVAVVFGAGVWTDGTPSPMLADRVSASVELYKQGKVQKLLMTGDNSRPDYDEVTAMQRLAVEKGVPEKDITLDYAGFSTYESCYRAKEIFGVKEAVLVTQDFHITRAIYTCNQLGINAVGLGTPDWGTYQDNTVMRYTMREKLSTLKALLELHITRPKPTFLGPFEGIK
jgi:vancomycin permeability regulator SanA